MHVTASAGTFGSENIVFNPKELWLNHYNFAKSLQFFNFKQWNK